jgi:hypothetical protein
LFKPIIETGKIADDTLYNYIPEFESQKVEVVIDEDFLYLGSLNNQLHFDIF